MAKAAIPKGNFYLTLRDHLGLISQDQDFSDLFPRDGQPALPPWQLALVTILQFRENLPDRQAAEAVRGRIDWKYLLGLELTDAGFDFSVISKFRTRLLEGGSEARLLDKLLEQCQTLGLVKARGTQRTDANRVLAAIRVLNRLELVGETMRAALNDLANVAPACCVLLFRWNGIPATAPPSKIIGYPRAQRDARPTGKSWEKMGSNSWICSRDRTLHPKQSSCPEWQPWVKCRSSAGVSANWFH